MKNRTNTQTATPTFQISKDQLEQLVNFLQQWAAINTVIELRGMETPTRKHILVAYLEPDPNHLTAQTLSKLLSETDGANLYLNVQRVHEGVICRSPFLWTPGGKGVSQSDVVRITHLVLDFDPDRPSGIPSSETEHITALNAADWLVEAVAKHYGYEPRLMLDTGNGAQVLYALDEPNNAETVKRMRNAIEYLARGLRKRFPTVKLDPATVNPAQLTRLPFTKNIKGHEWRDRVHRTVQLLLFRPQAAPINLSRWQVQPSEKPSSGDTVAAPRPSDLDELIQLLEKAGLEPMTPKRLNGDAWLIPLKTCAFDPSHQAGHQNPGVLYNNGKIGYKCFHSDCADKNGRAFRDWLAQVSSSRTA